MGCCVRELDPVEGFGRLVAIADEWNADYTERVVRMADLKGIGMTDDC